MKNYQFILNTALMFGFVFANVMLFAQNQEIKKLEKDNEYQSNMKTLFWDIADKVGCDNPLPTEAAKCLDDWVDIQNL